ncbi:MAG TPA: ectonucleotide pyrophosphatase/phosphodiesterase [Blastocatellia bacterium]|nr:ectonucleotide pyrophosphatase/phosphodiesterase [Blastocatellia bacterium]HMV83068.1 ectonucleotide pyrophosphatase/phosphodiesterase [Blastocatellia bacterium]HMX25412.1 ectonucleotide pyrophosphatase/phosphodiesterase [Blastocatellia bacterium]HMZ22605.1 ectonucleotide pyrophosphatase/phosphodiesterase [Blastocatellia bacterium]HNG33780.1 ectonucleotide pyrophosphatase/phosphodiesterase [Blastocatellia bacterium]
MKRIFPTLLVLLTVWHSAAAQTAPKPIKDLKPTVILISLDGFRPDYLEKYSAPTLKMLADAGVRAKWMTPSFPSLTFPNHYAIATGLYPDHNGIVANNIYAPEFNDTFGMNKREEVGNGRWWLGEPIWVTAEKQGQRASAFFFPGSEAEIGGKRPTFWKPFDDDFPNFERVDMLLSWLELPRAQRPTLMTLYYSDVDHGGHDAGPDSENVRQAIARVDAALSRLVEGLKARGIFNRVNLVIVSDHGMARVDPAQTVLLDDYFDTSQARQVAWNSGMVHIFPKSGMEDSLYTSLKAKAPHVSVYRKQELPARFHYGSSSRIGDIVVLADEGWGLSSRGRYKPPTPSADGSVRFEGGHGFDNQLESMRALFVAHGPAFKQSRVVEPFANVDVYNVMAKILKLKPAPNDGNRATLKAVLR